MLNPRTEREKKRGREETRERKVGKRERVREVGERKEGRLYSAPRSHAQIIVNAAKKKKKLQVGREIRCAVLCGAAGSLSKSAPAFSKVWTRSELQH